ncbi:MAG TPA: Asp-tRNA(Asn)/Glu-tRNA(Gln) amidotransferase subunit GatA [Vicinamibacteria bacterium]|nr:Asp-tRNA(Asn)/Glu-tRNA(Gln) amidotransferase subunit GatA [Vicinamibacteria bacterium]
MTIWRRTASEIAELTRSGELSAVDVTRSFLERIEKFDHKLKAFLHPMAESAIARARQLDSTPAGERGSLHGVPVAVKDIIAVAGTRCTCGSRILEDYVPLYDAEAVERLHAAGAVVLGKTNLDEFAMGSSTENSAFHPTRNPWNLDRVPGGSSGGSASAVAARLAPAALGTDTGGSIRQPAAFCGIVGLKPTYGRVSRYGLVAFASSFDQIGPLTRTVEDAALVLRAIAGHDPKDATSSTRPVWQETPDGDVSGLELGVPRELLDGTDPEVGSAFDAAITRFREQGVILRDVSLPSAKQAVAVYYLLATAEASSNLARYDGVRYGMRHGESEGLRGMIGTTRDEGFGAEVKRRILLGTFVLSSGYYDAYYQKAQKVRSVIAADFERAFESVDAILLPTAPTPPFRIGEKANDPLSMYLSDIFTITANLTGAPAVSLPAGFAADGLPLGVQIVGRPFDEKTILELGRAFERATGFHERLPPFFD